MVFYQILLNFLKFTWIKDTISDNLFKKEKSLRIHYFLALIHFHKNFVNGFTQFLIM